MSHLLLQIIMYSVYKDFFRCIVINTLANPYSKNNFWGTIAISEYWSTKESLTELLENWDVLRVRVVHRIPVDKLTVICCC